MNKQEVLTMTYPYTPHLFNSLGLTESGMGLVTERTGARPVTSRSAREFNVCVKRSRRPVYSMPTSALIY